MDIFVEKNWKGMIRPTILEKDGDTSKTGYGKFVAKPLE